MLFVILKGYVERKSKHVYHFDPEKQHLHGKYVAKYDSLI